MAELAHFKAGTSIDTLYAELQSSGGVIVEDFLQPEALARLNAELDPFVEAADPEQGHLNPGIAAFFGDCTRHVCGLSGKSRSFVSDVMCHPVLLALCDRTLLPSCASYQLNLGHLMDRGPGAEQQWIHRDELVWVHMPRPHPELQVASMVSLVDFEADIGATRVVPGSHRWSAERQPEPEEIAVAEMPAGSAVIYLGATLHAGGANTSQDRWRRGIHISYALGWLRTEENNVLATPPEVARTLPRRAQELLGYGVHDAIKLAGGYLGMLGLRNPADLLAAEEL